MNYFEVRSDNQNITLGFVIPDFPYYLFNSKYR